MTRCVFCHATKARFTARNRIHHFGPQNVYREQQGRCRNGQRARETLAWSFETSPASASAQSPQRAESPCLGAGRPDRRAKVDHSDTVVSPDAFGRRNPGPSRDSSQPYSYFAEITTKSGGENRHVQKEPSGKSRGTDDGRSGPTSATTQPTTVPGVCARYKLDVRELGSRADPHGRPPAPVPVLT